MNIQVSIALDSLALVFTFILFLISVKRYKHSDQCRIYNRLVIAIGSLLALDILYLLVSAGIVPFNRAPAVGLKNIYLFTETLIVYIWAKYAGTIVYGERYAKTRARRLFGLLFSANVIFIAVNLFSGCLFTVSDSGEFIVHNGPMWIFTAVNYLSAVASETILIRRRSAFREGSLVIMLLFPILPAVGEIVQILFGGCSLICLYSVSALLCFQVTQNEEIYTDDLTGISNRRMLGEYLSDWLDNDSDDTVCGIMIDLDNLKRINDTYGHRAGDKALISMANILRSVKCRRIYPIRYGGDEFMAVWLAKNADDIPAVIAELENSRVAVNRTKPDGEKISFSYGTYFCKAGEADVKDFIKNADIEMYKAKQIKKSL